MPTGDPRAAYEASMASIDKTLADVPDILKMLQDMEPDFQHLASDASTLTAQVKAAESSLSSTYALFDKIDQIIIDEYRRDINSHFLLASVGTKDFPDPEEYTSQKLEDRFRSKADPTITYKITGVEDYVAAVAAAYLEAKEFPDEAASLALWASTVRIEKVQPSETDT